MFQFPTVEAKDLWIKETEMIKFISEAISQETDEEQQTEKYHKWLERVSRFQEGWGDNRVPDDIRRAVHSVQFALNLPLTDYVDQQQ